MTFLQALVLGVVQGLAEFLPISSSAHLALTPWLFGWPAPGLAFDAALHLGTLAAVLLFFRAEWVRLARATMHIARDRRVDGVEQRRVVYLVIATVPAVIGGVLLEDYAETVFRAPVVTATTLIALGVLLWAVDRWMDRDRPLAQMRWWDAIAIGIAQVAALVPGVSRSGATITAGRALRLDRESAAVFSFLLSMPVTAGAALFKLPDAIDAPGLRFPLLVGILAAFASSWLAIAVLLRYVARHSYGIFALYRIALGIAVYFLLAQRG